MSAMTETRILHGGAPGLNPGDLILPPSQTGAERHTSRGKPGYTPSRVYVTTGLDWAQGFAYLRRGAVYEVRPLTAMRPDWDARVAPSWSCRRAMVVAVVVPEPAPIPEGCDAKGRALFEAEFARIWPELSTLGTSAGGNP